MKSLLPFHSHFSRRAFTLVELLVVIAIIGILAVLSLSMFSGNAQTSLNLTGTGNTVSGLAGLARQNAMTLNTRTLLVLAQVEDGGSPRSALSIWDANTTNQIEQWKILPPTIVATNTSTNPNATLPFACHFRGKPITAVAYSFSSDGSMGDTSSAPSLRLKPRQGDTSNYFDLIFSPLTGTAHTVRPEATTP